MGHKHLLVPQLYRLLRGALKQEHAKRLPQGFVQVGFHSIEGRIVDRASPLYPKIRISSTIPVLHAGVRAVL